MDLGNYKVTLNVDAVVTQMGIKLSVVVLYVITNVITTVGVFTAMRIADPEN
jgi:hypothetical protein